MMGRTLFSVFLFLTAVSVQAAAVPHPVLAHVQVRTIQGTVVQPLAAPNRTATVLLFIAYNCPICNSYSAEIHRLQTDYGVGKIAFYVVYTDVGVPLKKLQAHAKAHGYTKFALFDKSHALVKLTKAAVTPEAVVLGPTDQILYEGRIDNRYSNFGTSQDVATVSDLRRALDAIRADQPVKIARTKAIGCYIPAV
jgi:thiol-disulfide isomerase/thioredoxin